MERDGVVGENQRVEHVSPNQAKEGEKEEGQSPYIRARI